MRKIGYRIYKLRRTDVENTERPDPRFFATTERFEAFTLDPSGLGGGGWVNPDGALYDFKTAEMITSEAMKQNPDDEFTILPIYKA